MEQNKKDDLKRRLAEYGYSMGFGAQKHFYSYNIYKNLPIFISILLLFVGAAQLTPIYENWQNSGAKIFFSLLVLFSGIVVLVLSLVAENKDEYNEKGKEINFIYNSIRTMFSEIDSSSLDEIKQIEKESKRLYEEFNKISNSKQAFGSHLLAHYGLFYQGQSEWFSKTLELDWKDKFPILHIETFTFALFIGILIFVSVIFF